MRLAEHSGFCFGVRRAIQMALDARAKGLRVCTIGELIHNPQIVLELAEKGIRSCGDASGIHDSTVIVRSHGITKQEMEILRKNGNSIIDATCPYVKRTQELVQEMSALSYPVMILGDADHPEVIGMLSYGDEKTRVVKAENKIDTVFRQKLCLVSQTTQKLSNLQELVARLLPTTQELRVFNTICLATSQRQEAVLKLAKASDLMIIVGGRNSSNTRMLHRLCSDICPSIHVETEAELNEQNTTGFHRIGISAGASTPAQTIVNVFNIIKKINGEPADAETRIEDIPLFKEESC